MIVINAQGLGYRELNRELRGGGSEYRIAGCCGQRFIAAGMSDKRIDIEGRSRQRTRGVFERRLYHGACKHAGCGRRHDERG